LSCRASVSRAMTFLEGHVVRVNYPQARILQVVTGCSSTYKAGLMG